MDEFQITELFKKVLAKRDFTKRSGLKGDVVYNYRHRQFPSFGKMLSILHEMGEIKVVKNEFKE